MPTKCLAGSMPKARRATSPFSLRSIEIARGEAEDGLGTHRQIVAIEAKAKDEDDGAAEMAQRLAYRARRA